MALFPIWWSAITFNWFHLPTPEEPKLMSLLEDTMFTLCPPLVLEVLASGSTGYAVPLFIWVVAALLNGVLYYCIGLAVVALGVRVASRRATINKQAQPG